MSLQDLLVRTQRESTAASPVADNQKTPLINASFDTLGGTPASTCMSHGMATQRLLRQLEQLESVRSEQEISTAVSNEVKRAFGLEGNDFINIDAQKRKYGSMDPIEPGGIGESKANRDSLELIDPEELQREVAKRRIINHLIQGGAYYSYQLIDGALQRANLATPQISAVAKQFYAEGNLSMFLAPDAMFQLGQMSPGGTSKIDLSEVPAKVEARAPVIPLLLHEAVKGVLEIISSHGLPGVDLPNGSTNAERNLAKQLRKEVLHQADRTQYETWDLRFGISLWAQNFGETFTPQTIFQFQEFVMRPAERILNEL